MKYKLLVLIFLIGALSLTWIFNKALNLNKNKINLSIIKIAFAEREEPEDEDEDEEEEDDDDDDYDRDEEDENYENVETQPQTITVYKQEAIKIVEPGFDKDTDKDGLVDAIDPHLEIPESELFTDTDEDSIPNALDKYPNEDDLSYTEFLDINENGIRDDIE